MSKYRELNKFVWSTCNTIDDVTGMKVKLKDTRTRWDHIQTTKLNYEERQPQDFPVTPLPQRVYIDSRSQADAQEPAAYDPSTGWETFT